MMRQLLWKEFREHLGRWLPATLLLSGTLVILISARLMSIRETSVLIVIIGGVLLSIVLMIEPVPSERTRGTLDFLLALPMSRRRIAFAKWLTTGLSLAAMFGVAVLSGYVAAWRVGVDVGSMPLAALSTCVAMLALHSLLFWFLGRARNEVEAAMFAACLVVLAVAWSWYGLDSEAKVPMVADLAPTAPLFQFFDSREPIRGSVGSHVPSTGEMLGRMIGGLSATAGVWIIGPGLVLWWPGRKGKPSCKPSKPRQTTCPA